MYQSQLFGLVETKNDGAPGKRLINKYTELIGLGRVEIVHDKRIRAEGEYRQCLTKVTVPPRIDTKCFDTFKH